MKNFDPFQNRLCRDIRNGLSESLITALQSGNIGPALATAQKYLSDDLQPFIRRYINTRIARYETVLTEINVNGIRIGETFLIAALLWDQELFFEVHEWLEEKWHTAEGIEKKVIQALIRAAGTYVHLELGRNNSARKIRAKALENLIAYQQSVPKVIDINQLITKLKILDPVPPKLGASQLPANRIRNEE